MKSSFINRSAICIGLLLITWHANAQLGINAGWLNKSHSFKSDDISYSPSNGFFAGVDLDLYLDDLFVIAPGVQFSFAESNDLMLLTNDGALFGSVQEMALSLPVKTRYLLDFSDDFMLYPFVDAALEYGLRSLYKTQENGEIDLYKDADFKKWDVKVGGGLGVQLFECIKLECGYDFGLINRISGLLSHTNQLYLGLTFSFGGGSGYGSGATYYYTPSVAPNYGSYGSYGSYGNKPSGTGAPSSTHYSNDLPQLKTPSSNSTKHSESATATVTSYTRTNAAH